MRAGAFWGVVGVCAVVGCGEMSPPDGAVGSGGGSSGGHCAADEVCAAGGATDGGGAASGGTTLIIEDDGGGGHDSGCGIHCTSDLKSVVDCDGSVVEECTGGDACLDAVCQADACAAAAESQSSMGCDY